MILVVVSNHQHIDFVKAKLRKVLRRSPPRRAVVSTINKNTTAIISYDQSTAAMLDVKYSDFHGVHSSANTALKLIFTLRLSAS